LRDACSAIGGDALIRPSPLQPKREADAVGEEMADRRVTVFGGSGFLGREIVRRLAADGAAVRIAVRRPERAASLARCGRAGQVMTVRADVWDAATVAPALAGADAVVNTVGHYVERGDASFDAIHGQGARHVAQAAAATGVRRLVHISGIGADPASSSPYVRARATGERLVRAAFPAATILRPSVMFGPGDFLQRLAGLARVLPAMPLFGWGKVRLQTVYVRDVAAAVARALALPEAEGKLFELGGPKIYSYRALVQLALDLTGRRRPLLPVPYPVWHALAAVTASLPRRPISRDQVTLMQKDNVVSPGALGFADLGITPAALEAIAPTYLRGPSGRPPER
jgi:NADH dehydrogenase